MNKDTFIIIIIISIFLLIVFSTSLHIKNNNLRAKEVKLEKIIRAQRDTILECKENHLIFIDRILHLEDTISILENQNYFMNVWISNQSGRDYIDLNQ